MTEVLRIPEEWASCTLGDIVEFLDNERVPVNENMRNKRIAGKPQSALYPYYGANGQVGWIDDCIFDEPLVLLAEDGGFFDVIGKVAYRIEGKTWVNNHAHVLRPLPGINLGYVHYALNAMSLMPFVSGTTRLKLNQGNAQRIPIALAPQNEQKRIATIVEKLLGDLRIAKNSLQNAPNLMKRFRQSVLLKAFHGGLTEQDSNDEPAEKLLGRISEERRKKWEEGLRSKGKDLRKYKYKDYEFVPMVEQFKLPETWIWVRLGMLIESMKNGIYKSAEYYGSGIPCLRMYNIEGGKIVWKDIKMMNLSDAEVEEYGLNENDILLNRVNSRELVGKAAVIPPGLGNVVFESKNIRIRIWKNLVEPNYISFFLQTKFAREQIELECKQTVGMATVSQEDINQWLIPLPPLNEQRRIIRLVEELFVQSDQVEDRIENGLKDINDLVRAILSKAFHGELVPQDANDEPASILLERIRAQHATTFNKRSQTQLKLE